MATSYALPLSPSVGASYYHSAFLQQSPPHSPERHTRSKHTIPNASNSLQHTNSNQRSIRDHKTPPQPPKLHTPTDHLTKPSTKELPIATGDMARGARPRGESDLGRTNISTRNVSNGYSLPASLKSPVDETITNVSLNEESKNTWVEVLTANLIPLPFLLLSLLNNLPIRTDHSTHSPGKGAAEDLLEEAASTALPVTTDASNLLKACIITSGILILLGIWGRLNLSSPALERRRSSGFSKTANGPGMSGLSFRPIRNAFVRMLSVGLPFLATMELGGSRVGTLLLTAIAGSIISPNANSTEKVTVKTWKRALTSQRSICVVLALCFVNDLFLQREGKAPSSIIRGYVALTKSIFFFQPPLPTLISPSRTPISRKTSAAYPGAPASAWRTTATSTPSTAISPLINSSQDIKITLVTGAVLGIISLSLTYIFSSSHILTPASIVLSISCIGASGCVYIFSTPYIIQTSRKMGLAIGMTACAVFSLYMNSKTWLAVTTPFTLSCLLYMAVQVDTGGKIRWKKKQDHSHDHHGHNHSSTSKFTQILLRLTEDSPLLHGILLEKESRRIVYFMSINLAFMFIQTFYALAAGSLGLLSDSIHMFFDCVGLLAGLVASVMSKWPANARFPYGYGKVETLSGLGNGIFLIIISVEIIWESFERFIEGAELKRLNELLVVSFGGLVVNLLGLTFMGHHHHGHGHGDCHGHGHTHSHENNHSHGHKHKSSHDSHDEHQLNNHHEAHKHDESSLIGKAHGHHHSNENMAGIYLHILADTMGSVAVIISTLLTSYTGWSFWDPLASCIIAILIIAASCPLVVSSAQRLLLAVPYDVEYSLRNTLHELSDLRGVAGYEVPRFWLDDSESQNPHEHDHDHHHHHHHDHKEDHSHTHSHSHSHSDSSADSHKHDESHGQKVLGVIHITATKSADLQDVRSRVEQFLQSRNMNIIVHVDRESQRKVS